ncbi:MAG: GatB/YqeY domain-containing protein [Candidatus Pacebacteria bacterium]|nr:GatB/YqeY domain-containing protein [Candidatus Paceibacterota bacterium]
MKKLIQQDLNNALKAKQELGVSVLRGILAVIQAKEKEKIYQLNKLNKNNEKAELTKEEILNLIFSESKKREESIQEFKKGNRQDLVEKEEEEILILKKYLPEPLSELELKEIIKKAIENTKATQMQDIKKVIAEVMPQVKSRARGDQVGKIVKEMLCP